MTTQKLSLKEKIGYGFGDAASSMFWKLFGMYLMFFYTDVFGITAAVLLLTLYGYHAGTDQSLHTQQGIRLMLSLYPAIGALLAAFFMLIYPLEESFMTKI